MNSPKQNHSPSFKNIKSKKIQSPIELKEKMRKNYKNKVQKCRDMLLNRFRGPTEEDLKTTLTNIYENTFDSGGKETQNELTDFDESEIMEEIKQELIQEELNWWLEEYETAQSDNIDWSSTLKDENVICLICLKHNFLLQENNLSCPQCNLNIKTSMCLPDIKKNINEVLDGHSNKCSSAVEFTVIEESNESHIYSICEHCADMQFIV